MRDRIRVFGTTAVVKLISGQGKGDADTGLFLQGSSQCFDLAEVLLEAGNQIAEAEKSKQVTPAPSFYRPKPKEKR